MIPACPRCRASTSSSCRFRLARARTRYTQVGAIERPDELDRIAQAELRGDVAPDARGRGRGVGVQADAGKQRPQLPELPVLGTEVVPPLADAVRFVDGHEADVARREQVEKVLAPFGDEPLRRDVQQPEPSLAQSGHDRRFPIGRQRAVVTGGGDAVADQRVDLILHQRDQRRHDEGEAVDGPRRAPGKQSDLPPPVGSTTIESRPARIASIASRWSGRNEV